MTKTLPKAAVAAFALSLAACGSAAEEEVVDEYDADAPSLEEVASDAEMEAMAEEEPVEDEVAATPPPAIDQSDVTGDNADTEDVVGL